MESILSLSLEVNNEACHVTEKPGTENPSFLTFERVRKVRGPDPILFFEYYLLIDADIFNSGLVHFHMWY